MCFKCYYRIQKHFISGDLKVLYMWSEVRMVFRPNFTKSTDKLLCGCKKNFSEPATELVAAAINICLKGARQQDETFCLFFMYDTTWRLKSSQQQSVANPTRKKATENIRKLREKKCRMLPNHLESHSDIVTFLQWNVWQRGLDIMVYYNLHNPCFILSQRLKS